MRPVQPLATLAHLTARVTVPSARHNDPNLKATLEYSIPEMSSPLR